MSKLIAVIEDNDDVRENIAEILELANYKVVTAPNGIEGVKVVKSNLPDLIICDIMMPELDGFGVLHVLRKGPETMNIPFIFLTAKSEKDDFRKGMNLGADDYVTKPFEELELLEAIEMRLDKHVVGVSDEHSPHKVEYNKGTISRWLDKYLEEAEERRYPKKGPIYLEGAYPRYLYKVESGLVKKSKWTEFGKELILSIFKPGDYFGWPAIISNHSYSNVTTALKDTVLKLIPKEEIQLELEINRGLMTQVIHHCALHTEKMENKLLHTAYESVRKRMSRVILYLYKNTFNQCGIHLLREDLASFAGVSKETAIRVLSAFKEEGLIDINQNDIVITDMEALENLIG